MTITDLLDNYAIPYRASGNHHCRPGWVQLAYCPGCTPTDARYRLGLNLRRRYLSCWSCGSVPLVPTLSDLLSLPPAQVKTLLSGISTSLLPEIKPPDRGVLKLPPGLGPFLPAHNRYLKARKFDPGELAAVWGLKGLPGQGRTISRFAWRIFVPIVWRGELVSFTCRAVGSNPETPRYMSARPDEEKYDHKTLLGGEDLVPGHAVAVCEGPFDAFRIGPGAVWTSGTSYKRSQMLKIARYPVRLICFDAEAQTQARKLVRELSAFDGATYNVETSGKDPCTSPMSEIQEIRKMLL